MNSLPDLKNPKILAQYLRTRAENRRRTSERLKNIDAPAEEKAYLQGFQDGVIDAFEYVAKLIEDLGQ